MATGGNSLSKRYISQWIDTSPIWEQERGLNHEHPAAAGIPPEEAMELEKKYIDELIPALRQAFPGRAFTIAYIPENMVSFWQTTEDSPRKPAEGERLIFIAPGIER